MDENIKDRIAELFDQGHPLSYIAEQVGYCESRMSQILQERGRSAWKRRYPNQDGWDWEAIFADYQNRMPFEDLLHKHKVSCTTFHRQRKKRGIPKRPRLGAPGKQNYQYKDGRNSDTVRLHRRHGYYARKVAAFCLGHPLPKGSHVHHIDENPANNDPANMVLFPGNSQHMKYHQQLLKLQRADVEVDAIQLALENGGSLLPPPPGPIPLPRGKGRPSLRENQPLPKQGQLEL